MAIRHERTATLATDAFVTVLRASGLAARRPVDDPARIGRMLAGSDLIVVARDGTTGARLGVARSVTDFAYCCYLADLAVDRAWQGHCIGTRLIAETRAHAGPETMCLLLAAPEAEGFYGISTCHPPTTRSRTRASVDGGLRHALARRRGMPEREARARSPGPVTRMSIDATLPYDDANVFARILRGELPARTVYEDDHALAFHDIAPRAPVHILVIPKGRYVSWDDFAARAAEVEIAGFVRAVGHVARTHELIRPGYRLLANTGGDGGQEVAHLHVHLFGGRPLGPMLCH